MTLIEFLRGMIVASAENWLMDHVADAAVPDTDWSEVSRWTLEYYHSVNVSKLFYGFEGVLE